MKPSEELRSIINKSVKKFNLILEKDWTKKDSQRKWSKKEILGHLIDSASTNLRRFIITQYEQEQKIVYAQDDWVKIQNYQDSDIQEVIELWKLLNLQIVRTINSIPENKLQYVCDTGKETAEYHTLEFLIADYVVHLKHHLTQITNDKIYLQQKIK